MNELKPEDVMRCVDCLHHDACEDWANGWGIETNFPYEAKENLCKYFQPNSILREKDAEIERLTKDFWGSQADIKRRLADERSEAITEFVAGCVEMAIGIGNIPVVCLESILKFAEKMKGEIYGNKQGKTSKP